MVTGLANWQHKILLTHLVEEMLMRVGVVVTVANVSLQPVWLRMANGMNGTRRREHTIPRPVPCLQNNPTFVHTCVWKFFVNVLFDWMETEATFIYQHRWVISNSCQRTNSTTPHGPNLIRNKSIVFRCAEKKYHWNYKQSKHLIWSRGYLLWET